MTQDIKEGDIVLVPLMVTKINIKTDTFDGIGPVGKITEAYFLQDDKERKLIKILNIPADSVQTTTLMHSK